MTLCSNPLLPSPPLPPPRFIRLLLGLVTFICFVFVLSFTVILVLMLDSLIVRLDNFDLGNPHVLDSLDCSRRLIVRLDNFDLRNRHSLVDLDRRLVVILILLSILIV